MTWLFYNAGGNDYVELNMDLLLRLGDERRCVAIIILSDGIPEDDESFQVVVEGYSVSTNVTILDNGKDNFQVTKVGGVMVNIYFHIRCVFHLHWKFSCCHWQHCDL